MPPISRPMKAPTESITDAQLERMQFPIVGSPKLDGLRCVVDGVPLTSALKSIGNRFVVSQLSCPEFDGLDGELVVGSPFRLNEDDDVFWRTSGAIRRSDGEPDFKFYAFDDFHFKNKSYEDRWLTAPLDLHPRLVILEQVLLSSVDDVRAYEQAMVEAGYEGAMIRSLSSKYKEGRCTLNEMSMFKRKPFEDAEGIIIGLEEAMLNLNEATTSELGLTKRSKIKGNLVPKDTLGAFVIKSPHWEKEFRATPGKGFTADKKKSIWDNPVSVMHKIATFSYQKYGSREKPRMARVTKIRDAKDITAY